MTDFEPLDAAAKERIRTALKAQAEAAIGHAHDLASSEHSAAELGTDTPHTDDDVSQSDEEGEFVARFEEIEDQQELLVGEIDELDLGPHDSVVPGAVVAFGGGRYVVGVVAAAFDSDGVSYECISVDSPLYAVIEGLKTGDAFSFDGHEQRIDFVA